MKVGESLQHSQPHIINTTSLVHAQGRHPLWLLLQHQDMLSTGEPLLSRLPWRLHQ